MNINNLFRRSINWTAVGKSSALTPEILGHLRNVYTTLAVSVFSAAIGAYVAMQLPVFSGLMTFFAILGLVVWMSMTPPEQVSKRLALLLSLAFFQGATLGPFIKHTINIDPSIVVTAFVGTTAIFACFSGMSLFAVRRSYLYLYGTLSSALSLLAILSFFNMFARSAALFNIQLYFGLMLFCGFIIFDTQLIIEKRFAGDKDFVGHALELFWDFISVFVRLLIILSKNKEEKKRDSSRR